MRRLLIAHDFSQGSARALLRGIRLAASHKATIRLVHCTEGPVEPPHRPSTHGRLIDEAEIMAEEIGSPDLEISACVRFGDAADAILIEARAFDADLIVMGGHGAPRLRDAIFGTTATHVVRHSDRAVLVVQDAGRATYPSLMVAIDDPLAAQPLLTTAFAIAPAAETVAVHAFHPTLGQTLWRADDLEGQQARLERKIEEAVSAAAAGNAARSTSVNGHAMVEMGEVLGVLMKAYDALEPSLLALGTRERATYLGSHAVDTLFWCPHDMLVVPDGARVMAPAAAAGPPVALHG